MSSASSGEIIAEFRRSKIGMAGIILLGVLIAVSVSAMVLVPLETLKKWNNPEKWISYPKTAVPAWINWLPLEKIPEHIILEPAGTASKDGEITVFTHSFVSEYAYDDFPSDFIYEYLAVYSGSPMLEITVTRPDGAQITLMRSSLPYSAEKTSHGERIFSADESVRKNVYLDWELYDFAVRGLSAEDVIFSDSAAHRILKGEYVFSASLYGTDGAQITESSLILGGKAFGLMGTDELRRDLAVGLVWGTPLALFIGVAVAVGSVIIGLVYGVYAGYRGKLTDEAMMRFNDVIYALPALPVLIILAVTISSSIFLMIGFLMIFGWVGVAKVSRSMALQIKTRGYVEAAKMMGQKNSRIIFRHILPQLLPYAFASIAISVPAAITTEAGLSFLGLGDPTFPTWGQILHDANEHGAAARGLWWWVVPPGIMIAVTGLAFVFIGNALDGIVNPRLKR